MTRWLLPPVRHCANGELPVTCPAPDLCVYGPADHDWSSDCERRDEGWSTDVPSSSAHHPLEADGGCHQPGHEHH